ncbi:ABC transporter ATP-binding protein [Kitasatospora herbaricolor]|uniref:ABC transporter ATP-binding protein n=1 Tax=Kitasatospora herbaricolor TaxID=68217 RepID=UPI001748D808|nr:ABC transporter ATP-binding protein [Kitasatospora herbaricolor]MDQ0311361.1 ABC-type multidrug transport system fused ATPase/permease subunit [Kitasatospora herbaricolor]GGV22857.1 ABC transporter ATP-binding protein [Kitasatospora herbaricolor]
MAEQPLLQDEADQRAVLRRAAPYLRPHRGRLAVALGVGLADSAALVAVAPLIGLAADSLDDGDRGGLGLAVALLVALAAAQLVLARVGELLLIKGGEQVVRTLREQAVENLATAPLRFLETHRGGELLRRATGEVAALAAFVRLHLRNMVASAATLVFTLVMLAGYSWLLLLVQLAVFLPLTLLVTRWFQRDAGAAFGGKAGAEATVAATFSETLTAREALQTSRGLAGWTLRFERENTHAVGAARRAVRVENRIDLVSLIEGAALVVLLLAGGWLVDRDSVSLGTVVVFVVAGRNLFDSFAELSQLVGEVQTARTGLARLLDLLAATRPQGAAAQAPAGLPARGDLRCVDVEYAYRADGRTLHGISLDFPEGSRTGVVGETGSGKTTLSKLLCGLYRPDSGAVTFAGTDLADLPEAELRRRIVLVPQEVRMVSGTIADNLALVQGAPDRARIERTVDQLGLRDWTEDLPGGLDAEVGQRGGNLSAGERQILGLVRAVLADPAVLVLDEATADIDPVTAARLEHALDELRADCTLVVIAHRPATIARMPRVVRLDGGRLLVDEPAGGGLNGGR